MNRTHLADEIDTRPTTARDLVHLFLGKIIGRGSAREVYQCAQDGECVIKVELEDESFQNVVEWEIWQSVKETKFAKYFAPCVAISSNGIFLVQKKVDDLHKKDFPKKVPHFFSDRKYRNYGLYKGNFVCRDYGTMAYRVVDVMKDTKILKKANWWQEDEN